jgi:hypothetical protein
MRNPIEWGWSHVQVAVYGKFKAYPDDIRPEELSGEILAFMQHHLFDPKRLDRNDYAKTIRRWRGVFGKKPLMWFRYERMYQDPRGLLVDICRHIGADTEWVEGLNADMLRQNVLEPKKIPFPPALRAEYADRCASLIDDLENLLGEKFDDWRSWPQIGTGP